jgi:short-subunit dehydrogenase
MRKKPLHQQVVVLTGATSGIGLATARLLAERGAALLIVSRNAEALHRLREELRGRGARVELERADVADPEQVRAVAAAAEARFGGFDTWINDAGVFLYGRLDETTLEDQRQLFDVIYWGVVHGSLEAARGLARRGGTIINLGSVLSDIAMPYQGAYSAAKHAVKGFTEAFRREIEAARLPIGVTLIKPAAIDTPFMEHARNRIGSAGTKNPPPAYAPRLVARAIAHACEHDARDLTIGGAGGTALVVLNTLAPRLMDLLLSRAGRAVQTTDDPGRAGMRDTLYEPREELDERSSLTPFTRRTSLALEAQLHPWATLAALLTVGAFVSGIGSRRPAG